MIIKLRTIRNLAVILALLVLAGGVGYNLGQRDVKVRWKNLPQVEITNKLPPSNRDVDFSLFWDVWSRVESSYVDKSKLQPQTMVYGAISGMVSSLGDPYTVFLPPQENKESKEELNGSFEGIGAQLGIKENKIVVVAPVSGMPAEAAGIKAGDWIVKVDGKETANWTLPEAVNNIRGTKGTEVTLTILHPGQTKTTDVKVVRNTIVIKSIEWQVKEASGSAKEIVYLRLSRFGDTTNTEFDTAVTEITEKMQSDSNIRGLVLDLRNNPGGYLNGAVYVASEFLKDGEVVKQANGDGTSQTFTVNRQGKLTQVPMVVLINQGSASASEIVAGALQARGRAKLIGTQSFGKGSVQEAQDLPGGAGLHVTISKWLLPDGRWINGSGLTPDDKIEQDENDPTRDLQLEKAIEILTAG